MRIKCIVSYDGTNFYGFQKQTNKRSVQAVLEKALFDMTKEKTKIFASGRTDSGVHARGQVFHFDTNFSIPLMGWKNGLNSLLPSDVHIIDVEEVDSSFHSRYSAIKKEYRYYIKIKEYDPIVSNYTGYYEKLDIEEMGKALQKFEGTHDFKGFASVDIDETIRTIYEAKINVYDQYIELVFIGDGFMRYMVRRIVGTLVEVGMGRYDSNQIEKVFENPKKYLSGKTAQSSGLFLYKVYY